MANHNTELRQDITGLRAVAVLAVTLYHIAHVLSPDNSLFKGGFLGVDIFFVISGFLMTKIIMTGLDRGNFSLFTFYKRRAKRICPALLVTIIVFVVAAILVLDTTALVNTCRDGLRALGFISNYWLASKTGYFDGAATERLFLHTWSLSVEWQFYLIYPLLMMLCAKLVSRKVLGLLILGLTLASLVFGCIYTNYNSVNSYFFLHSRAYELLIGALAYFYPLSFFFKYVNKQGSEQELNLLKAKTSKQVEYLGLLCIAVSLFIVDSSNGWPNFWSVLPLFGTYLCIAADNKETLLSNVVFQKLGLWSYAIYLVHWPLIVLVGGFSGQSVSWELLPLILILGIALHYGVERRRNFGWGFLAFYFAIAGSVQWLIKTDGTYLRNVPVVDYPSGTIANDGVPIHIGNKARPVDFILVGDSYARQYIGVLDNENIHVIALTNDACVSTSSFYLYRKDEGREWNDKCHMRYSNLVETAKQNPNVPIVWGQNWASYIDYSFKDSNDNIVKTSAFDVFKQDISVMLKDFAESNNRLYVVGQPKDGRENGLSKLGPKCYPLGRMDNLLTNYLWDVLNCRTVVELPEPSINNDFKVMIEEVNKNDELNGSLVFVDPSLGYCSGQNCRIMVEESYEPYFFDASHFSKYAAEPVWNSIVQQIHQSSSAEQQKE